MLSSVLETLAFQASGQKIFHVVTFFFLGVQVKSQVFVMTATTIQPGLMEFHEISSLKMQIYTPCTSSEKKYVPSTRKGLHRRDYKV